MDWISSCDQCNLQPSASRNGQKIRNTFSLLSIFCFSIINNSVNSNYSVSNNIVNSNSSVYSNSANSNNINNRNNSNRSESVKLIVLLIIIVVLIITEVLYFDSNSIFR